MLQCRAFYAYAHTYPCQPFRCIFWVIFLCLFRQIAYKIWEMEIKFVKQSHQISIQCAFWMGKININNIYRIREPMKMKEKKTCKSIHWHWNGNSNDTFFKAENVNWSSLATCSLVFNRDKVVYLNLKKPIAYFTWEDGHKFTAFVFRYSGRICRQRHRVV